MLVKVENAESSDLKLYYLEMANSWKALAERAERRTPDRGSDEKADQNKNRLPPSPIGGTQNTIWNPGRH